ncbi:hypothetical protein AAC03nite_28040 [Alicyclobacillus acidoterrestris]|nr:hypothetical protein AAC03nite_28040 [Alicyclobacillus acidoterrestris]
MVNPWRMLLVKNEVDRTYDITPLCGAITWDTYLSLTCELTLPIMWSDTSSFPKNPCELGDMVLLSKNDEEVQRWILTKSSQQGRNPITYTGYDWAWYLGQSKVNYQFNGIPADQAVRRILADFGMIIGTIAPMSAKITKIYMQQTPSDIIDDILTQQKQQSGREYSAEMVKGVISIVPTVNRLIKGTFTIAGVTADVMLNALDAQRDRDLTALRNRIDIITSDSDTYTTQAIAQDSASISKYGLLADTYTIESADVAKSRQVAKILLQRLNRIQESNTITLMGDPNVRAGYLININEPITGMKGQYMIQQATHTVSNQVHTMQITLVLPQDVA